MNLNKIFQFFNFFKIKSLNIINDDRYKREQTAIYPKDSNLLLKPYVVKFDFIQSSRPNMPMTEIEFYKIQSELTNAKNFLNEEKSPVLKKIYDNALWVYQQLKPLETLGLKFSIDVTGGAARDFILNKHNEIKDLDIMISFDENCTKFRDYDFNDIKSYRINKEKLLTIFTEDELNTVQWTDESPDPKFNYKINQLIHLCFLKTNSISANYLHQIPNKNGELINIAYKEMNDNKERLTGVLKLNGPSYEIDLLITPMNKREFRNSFDIDFCKASFCFINQFLDKKFPKHYSHLVSRFTAEPVFYAAVLNKKISVFISPYLRTNESYLTTGKRCAKFLDKFNDFKIDISTGDDYSLDMENLQKERLKHFNIGLAYHQLHDKINNMDLNNEQKPKSLKI